MTAPAARAGYRPHSTTDSPLAGPESLKNVRTTTGERLLIRGEIRLPLTASLDLQPVGVRPLRNDQQG